VAADDSHLTKDPVCGKEVDTLRARAVGIFGGVTYYFCSSECKAKFGDPRKARRDPSEQAWTSEERPERQRRSTMENWKVLADAAEPSHGGEAAPKEEVRYAKSKKKRAVEPADESAPKEKVSPSIEEEVPRSSGRVWMALFVIFAAAGVALFYALK
jgi:YHS domain-containing protein